MIYLYVIYYFFFVKLILLNNSTLIIFYLSYLTSLKSILFNINSYSIIAFIFYMEDIKDSNQNHKSQSFSFQNLQPMNYLKTFNKMLQYMVKTSPAQNNQTSRELKLVSLSRYPLHPYYEQMQGILEGHHKKQKQNYKSKKKQFQLSQNEELFLKKHHQFVKDALQKIIKDNETQQKYLQKQKKTFLSKNTVLPSRQYQEEIVKLVKLRSEPKLRSMKSTIKSQRQFVKINPQKLVKNQPQFRAKTERKQQKIPSSMTRNMGVLKARRLNEGQDQILLTKKLQRGEANRFLEDEIVSNQQQNLKKWNNHQPAVSRQAILKITQPQDQNYNKDKKSIGPNGSSQDIAKKYIEKDPKISLKQIETQEQKFKKLVATLQKQQAQAQKIFSQNLQSKINSVNQKMKQRIRNVKSFDCSLK